MCSQALYQVFGLGKGIQWAAKSQWGWSSPGKAKRKLRMIWSSWCMWHSVQKMFSVNGWQYPKLWFLLQFSNQKQNTVFRTAVPMGEDLVGAANGISYDLFLSQITSTGGSAFQEKLYQWLQASINDPVAVVQKGEANTYTTLSKKQQWSVSG